MVPRKEREVWVPTDPETALWEVLAVGRDCHGIEVGMSVIVTPRAPAFETPSGRDDEAMFKIDDIEGIYEG